jgi:hypothetical protein
MIGWGLIMPAASFPVPFELLYLMRPVLVAALNADLDSVLPLVILLACLFRSKS